MRPIITRQHNVSAVIVTVLLCTGLIAGCVSPRQEASDTARTFLTAAQNGDQVTVAQVLTAKARENAGASMSTMRSGNHQTGQGFTVGVGDVNGEVARVPVTLTDANGTSDADVQLRREDGRWRVYGITLKSGFGPTLAMDFEHPENTLGEAFRTAGQTLGVVARGLEQGAKNFETGFTEGYGKSKNQPQTKRDDTEAFGATIEEVPPSSVK